MRMKKCAFGLLCVTALMFASASDAPAAPGECGPGYQKENYGCVPIRRGGGPYYQGYPRAPRYQDPTAYRPGECGPGYQKENYGCVPIYRGGPYYQEYPRAPRYQDPTAYRP